MPPVLRYPFEAVESRTEGSAICAVLLCVPVAVEASLAVAEAALVVVEGALGLVQVARQLLFSIALKQHAQNVASALRSALPSSLLSLSATIWILLTSLNFLRRWMRYFPRVSP